MVSRIMVSLRKAAALQQKGSSLERPRENRSDFRSLEFAHPQTGGTNLTEDETARDMYPEP